MADEFLAILTQALSSRTAKAVADTPTTYRGLFNQRQADKVNSMVTEALAHGASIVSGTQGSDKNLVQPIVLENVNVESKIYKEEIFGPALIVHRFKTVEEAIHLANDNDYGLAAAVYGVSLFPPVSQEVAYRAKLSKLMRRMKPSALQLRASLRPDRSISTDPQCTMLRPFPTEV